MDDLLALAESAVAHAREAGATDADATASRSERFSTEARSETVTKLEQSTGRSLSVRVFIDGAKASLTTTELSADGVAALVAEVVAAARYVAADPFGGIPEAAGDGASNVNLEIDFADVRERSGEAKIADARALETEIRAYDGRIDNSSGSRVTDSSIAVALANSRGFAGMYRASSVLRMTSPIARDGSTKRTASYGTAARTYADLESVEAVGRTAARRAVELCGARKPKTMRVPVIFERDVAAVVLGDVFTSLNGANVAVGNSFLLGRIGERIGSDLVTLVDDGRRPRGLGTAPFDAEGTPTRRTVAFERGVVRSFLCDTAYGKRLGMHSTGNASGGGIGPTNFYLEPGLQSLEELIAATPRGVFIVDTIGFSTESVSGGYSRGARGMMIENGELAYPIDEFTIAGKLPEMLAAIDGVANDLRFDGTIVSPSFRVAEMTISGT
ncbi:MAG: TldD/PmbA family protein [Candidatus Eremiobacteraeota bacterium]|nr:TldD/PmbA family protein [Candidatus Eremiobacteraeota bacterium]